MPRTFSFRQLFSCLIVAVISAPIACSGHTAASRPPDVQVASVVTGGHTDLRRESNGI